MPDDERERIRPAVLACANVQGVHDLRTDYAGDRTFVEFHLELDGQFTVEKGHIICGQTETTVRRLFPAAVEVTAHLEPAGIDDDRLDDRVASAEGVRRKMTRRPLTCRRDYKFNDS
jgi:divalent metal cation (Fe/Co/Zn/Cd) transporter